jgi:effector-binding domain-containing protein
MPKVSNFEILYKREQPTLFIRARAPIDDLPMLIGESYGQLTAYFKEMDEYLADVPYVAYYNLDTEDLDVEMGFPTRKSLGGKGDIQTGIIPAGPALCCMYRGPYDEIGELYIEMSAWVKENNLKHTEIAYEYFFNGPGLPESEFLTMLVMPLVEEIVL